MRVIAAGGRPRLWQTALQRNWGVADSGVAEMPGTAGVLKRLALGAGFTAAPGPHDDQATAALLRHLAHPAMMPGPLICPPLLATERGAPSPTLPDEPIAVSPLYADLAADLEDDELGYAEDEEALPPPPDEDETWARRLSMYRQNRMWLEAWGPRPGQAGCLVPEGMRDLAQEPF